MFRSPIRKVRLENSTPIVCAECSLTAIVSHQLDTEEKDMLVVGEVEKREGEAENTKGGPTGFVDALI